MCFHNTRLFAWLLDLAMRNRDLVPYRERAIAAARGRVLEIGVGSGLNLPLYRRDVARVYGIDPSAALLEIAKTCTKNTAGTVLVRASAENLPFKDKTFDIVVTTFTLCTIPNALKALVEMRRVLNSSGRLIFAEHGQAPDWSVARWQNWLTPCWRRLSGGCHLNRSIDELIRAAGFQIDEIRTGYLRGANPFAYMYEGTAVLSDGGRGESVTQFNRN